MTVSANRKRKFAKSSSAGSSSTTTTPAATSTMSSTSSTETTDSKTTTGAENNVGIKYSCDYCYKDISCSIRFQCAQCGLKPEIPPEETAATLQAGVKETHKVTGAMSSNLEEVDLCVECFSSGVSFNSHSPHHPYRILNPLDFPVYHKDWRADEELLLLEAIESLGLGNWEDLSEQLGNRFSPEDCKKHYIDVYLRRSKDHPQAPGSFLPAKRGDFSKTVHEENSEFKTEPKSEYKSEPSPTPTTNKKSKTEATAAKTPTPQSIPANHEIVGYMPGRGGDCEVETENEAESSIKDLQFFRTDRPTDRTAKLSLLEIYSSVLDRREAKHAFIRSHKLHHYRRQQALDRARSKEEREVHQMIRPLAPHIDAKYYQLLVEGLLVEKDIRTQIERLQSLREVGCRTQKDARECESEKRTLDHFLRQAAQTTMGLNGNFVGGGGIGSIGIGSGSTTTTTTTTSSSATSGTSSVGSGDAILNYSSFDKETPHPLPTPIRVGGGSNNGGGGDGNINDGDDISNTRNITNSSPQHQHQQTSLPPLNAGRKASTPLNISHAEGVELLSEKERHICSILRLYPNLYLSIKDTLIKEYIKQGGGVEGGTGGLKRAQARAAVKIDVNKTSKLYDFFVAAGWIRPPASGE